MSARLAAMQPRAQRPWRCRRLVPALLLLPALAFGQADERLVKVAYIFNFIQFTHWPLAPDDPFRLCVLGTTPLDAALAALNGKSVLSGQRIQVLRIEPTTPITGCHALYVDGSQRTFSSDVLQRARGQPILTITDSEPVAERGIMLEIVRRDQRLGFEVNLDAARGANLTFSSHMLKLASFVRGRGD